MYPPGSGVAPSIFGFSNTCTTAGVSLITFSCNKQISGTSCQLSLINDATGQIVWFGSIDVNTNAKPFTISGTSNGSYTLGADNGENNKEIPIDVFCLGPPQPLSLDYVAATAVTQAGGGTVTVRASGGVNPLFAILSPLNLRQQLTPNAQGALETVFGNIPAGVYPGYVADSSSPPQIVNFTATVDPYAPEPIYGCTDPSADNYDPSATVDNDSCVYTPVPRVAYFEVPAMQSLRFVQPTRLDKPAFDNTLLKDEQPLDYTNPGYCQLVEQGDTLVLQALSNYQGAPALTLKACAAGDVALTVPGVRVQQGAGQTPTFECYLKPDPAAQFTRIYFSDEALPLPFLPGQRVTIGNTGTRLDATYPLHDVLEDAAAAVPYLRILAPYPSGNIRVDGTLTTTYAVQAYDTYQFVVPFASIAAGCYHAEITASDNDFSQALATSEPLEVATVHAHTKLIAYRNFDNAWGINYSHGQVNRQRVVGRFFDRLPAGEKTVLRNDDSELELLSASVYRKVQLETLLLPGWLHEVLFVAFAHDFVKIDDVRVVLEGDYTYTPVERYTQGKGSALLEVKNFLGAGNRDDLGEPGDDGDFLVANGRYLAVNI